jgi:hypothetical protein
MDIDCFYVIVPLGLQRLLLECIYPSFLLQSSVGGFDVFDGRDEARRQLSICRRGNEN